MAPKEIGLGLCGCGLIHLVQRPLAGSFEHGNQYSGSIEEGRSFYPAFRFSGRNLLDGMSWFDNMSFICLSAEWWKLRVGCGCRQGADTVCLAVAVGTSAR
jgi:hypothetical protein